MVQAARREHTLSTLPFRLKSYGIVVDSQSGSSIACPNDDSLRSAISANLCFRKDQLGATIARHTIPVVSGFYRIVPEPPSEHRYSERETKLQKQPHTPPYF